MSGHQASPHRAGLAKWQLAKASYYDAIGIMKRSLSEADHLVAALRRHLRHQGWTARRLAVELDIGEATAKRWLAGRSLTLERLERLAALCSISLADLIIESRVPRTGLAQELTLAQETALAASPALSFLFVAILGGFDPGEVGTDFHWPADSLEAALARLERLALIDRLPGGRARATIDRAVIWRKRPMRALFERRMKGQFFDIDYASEAAIYSSEVVKLSPAGSGALAELVERFRRDVQQLAEQDRREWHLPGQWFGTLCVARPIDTVAVERIWDDP